MNKIFTGTFLILSLLSSAQAISGDAKIYSGMACSDVIFLSILVDRDE